MGSICSSTPLQKIKNQNSTFNPANTAKVAEYTSITSFILQNENPVMYDWSFKSEIGTGSMSHVFKVQNISTGELAAAKVYSLNVLKRKTLGVDEIPIVSVQREIDIMSEIRHPHVLRIVDVFEDDPTQSLLIITDFASLGSVQALFEEKKMTEDMIMTCFYQVALALSYMHSRNMIHRDIKPENILAFTESYYVLSDFSVSTKLKQCDERLSDTKGSPAFLSPEECKKGDFAPKPADVWSYGISLYLVLFNELPFGIGNVSGNTVTGAMRQVSKNLESEPLSFPEGANPLAVELISKLLDKNPNERPTFDKIVDDPFFEKPRDFDIKSQLEEIEFITSKMGDTSEGSFRIE